MDFAAEYTKMSLSQLRKTSGNNPLLHSLISLQTEYDFHLRISDNDRFC